MGAGESKEDTKCFELFSLEEKQILKDNFLKISGGHYKSDRITIENALKQRLCLPQLENLGHRLCNLMAGRIQTNNTITLEGYVHCCGIMLKGMHEEKARLILYLAKGSNGPASYDDCFLFTKQVVLYCFHILKNSPSFQSWDGNVTQNAADSKSLEHLAVSLTNALRSKNDQESKFKKQEGASDCDEQSVYTWLANTNIFYELFNLMGYNIFQLPTRKNNQLLPLCRGLPSKVYPSWLTIADILYINSALPIEFQGEWRFLFSSRIHGENFSSLMGNIIDKGPTLIFIKDVDGYIFGGFASTSWTINPHFTGSSKNFVFRLSPEMSTYHSTGFNDHYQYLNIQQQTFPNGLGMGGQLEYFGFWIDADYGKGKCSPSCTTYTNPQLSAKTEFLIDRIEVWAVGPEPEKDEEEMEARPSILDVDVEGQAMLRMLNRGPLSEGMRENPTSDEPEEKQLYVTMPE